MDRFVGCCRSGRWFWFGGSHRILPVQRAGVGVSPPLPVATPPVTYHKARKAGGRCGTYLWTCAGDFLDAYQAAFLARGGGRRRVGV